MLMKKKYFQIVECIHNYIKKIIVFNVIKIYVLNVPLNKEMNIMDIELFQYID